MIPLARTMMIIAAFQLISCASDNFSGNISGKKEKNSSDASADDDERSKEPVMVGGAYLFCESGQSGSRQFSCGLNEVQTHAKVNFADKCIRDQWRIMGADKSAYAQRPAAANSKYHQSIQFFDDSYKSAQIVVDLSDCKGHSTSYPGVFVEGDAAKEVAAIGLVPFNKDGGITNELNMPITNVLFESLFDLTPDEICRNGSLDEDAVFAEYGPNYEAYGSQPERMSFSDRSYCFAGKPERGSGCFVIPVVGRGKEGYAVVSERQSSYSWAQIEKSWMRYSCPTVGSGLLR